MNKNENEDKSNNENNDKSNNENVNNSNNSPPDDPINVYQQDPYKFKPILPDPITVTIPPYTIPRPNPSASYSRGYHDGFRDGYNDFYKDSFIRGFNSFVVPASKYKVSLPSMRPPSNDEEDENKRGGFKQDKIVEPTLDDIREDDQDSVVDVPVEEFI